MGANELIRDSQFTDRWFRSKYAHKLHGRVKLSDVQVFDKYIFSIDEISKYINFNCIKYGLCFDSDEFHN